MIRFNGTHSDTFSDIISIMNVRRPAFQGARAKTMSVSGRDGTVYFGNDRQPKPASWRIALKSDSAVERRQAIRQIANWLITRDVSILQFDDEPAMQYYAVLISPIDTDEFATNGFLDVEMLVPDGYAHGVTVEEETSVSGDLTFNNGGTATPFILEATLKTASTDMTITLTENEYIKIEDTLAVDDVVEIDTLLRTVEIDDVDKRGKVTFDSSFFKLPSGGGTLTPDPADTELKLTWREKYN